MKLLLFALILAVPPSFAADDVNVSATVDRDEVGVGDIVNLQIAVNSAKSVNVEAPQVDGAIPGAQVIGSSSGSETRSSFENGRFQTTQSRVFYYQLLINKKGKLVIPPLNVTVDGRNYQTEKREVAVNDARRAPPGRAQQQQQPDPFDQGDDMEELFQQMLQRHFGGAPGGGGGGGMQIQPVNPNEAFFIQAETDKKKAFVGEQITASFYLVTRGNIRDIDTLRYPDLKGFWKEDLEMATRLNFENVVINGQAYQRALLVSYALFPIKAGKAVIDPYKAKCTVLTPTAFGLGRPYVFTKASTPIPIEVEDIPQNRPADYTGAVGHFRVSAAFEPPTGTTNQPVTLRVRFEGQGNAKLIELPKLALPPTFELYDQKSQAQFAKNGTSFKEFEVLIIPREPGVFQIPPVAISVFDPQTRKFTQVSSQALSLSVTGSGQAQAPAQAQTGTSAPPPTGPKEPTLPSLATEFQETHISNAALGGVTAVIYALVLVFLAVTGFRRLRGKPKKQSLQIVLKRRLKNVRDLAAKKEWRRMGVELTNAAYYILGQLSEQGGANQELSRLLEQTPPSLRNELSEPIRKLLAQCEALSFAPESVIGDMTEKSRTDSLIKDFEKVMTRAIELADV
jgi:hypothetical protein